VDVVAFCKTSADECLDRSSRGADSGLAEALLPAADDHTNIIKNQDDTRRATAHEAGTQHLAAFTLWRQLSGPAILYMTGTMHLTPLFAPIVKWGTAP
jgi:hypothetical protein